MQNQHDFSGDAVKQHFETFLRRAAAAAYVRERYGFCTERSLAKMAVQGNGPPFRKYGARVCLYARDDLDQWAREKIGAPRTSTSENKGDRPARASTSANASKTNPRPSGRANARRSRAVV
jgi:hypothetical protein